MVVGGVVVVAGGVVVGAEVPKPDEPLPDGNGDELEPPCAPLVTASLTTN